MLSLSKTSPRSQLLRMLVILFILAIAAIPAISTYFTGSWVWKGLPEVPRLEQLRAIEQEGLVLPEWQTLNQETVEIGGQDWSVQAIAPTNQVVTETSSQAPIFLMLRPQTWQRDQPQVEWMDINGVQRWTADSKRQIKFEAQIPSGQLSDSSSIKSAQVEARFLRGWNQRQTYAVLQWYAWSDGGNPAPSHWFWADQRSQWRNRHRMPWVAVSILIPIQPLGDIEQVRTLAITLGQTVQSALMQNALSAES
ncbi:cyanoexosortase B system-associated protein [Oculatella sp. FACHB-28]|uniref:cyanoexosortase B system-associated protein n=1 Tax=Cyanophyceae TaxID=3028117 RepID=UPI00168325FF|nr:MULTISPECIES: cyanoexosortase B system-associated protein [Cyanophyceae]MBD1866907.1 cyanoexosortase B system-associated protein [Cyanobacteria bacterium FACHB-471]MBD2058937.1 cyanoexosortase B system-associated protein [Oculatella sp. FACHB-28]MBD2070984.1 cyanoexosortase B system-associated protein [Leptolyngbya sp. FACHB-671]